MILVKNIKRLVQVREEHLPFISGKEMKVLPYIDNAYLYIENGLISSYGEMSQCPIVRDCEIIDAQGKYVLPCWCDSHTHIVYAGNRESEFVDRIIGKTYQEIAENGGGILNSAKKLQATSFDDLYAQSEKRLQEIISMGTGAVEIKSGYGLTKEAELMMLRVIKKLAENYDLPIKATFLGAHALPTEYKENKNGYLAMLIDEVLPVIVEENLAEYIDVFCEEGYFTAEDTALIIAAGKSMGLTPKIHVNQFNSIGGVQVGVRNEALSVDHLEVMNEEDIAVLKGSKTMPVALPSCSFFLSIPYTPARAMIDEGLPLALATDYNPGSTPSGNMNFVVATACIKMKMTPAEAINAATINGAYAMGLEREVGSITTGKRANFMITEPMNSLEFLPYSFGKNHIESVYLNGKKQ